MSSHEDEALKRAWQAYEEQMHEEALEAVEVVDAEDSRRWLLEALARTEIGQLGIARGFVERLRTIEAFGHDADCLWASAQLLLREWRIDEARDELVRLVELDPSPAVFESLALCDDVDGRLDDAHAHLERAAECAGGDWQPHPRLSTEAFEAAVLAAIEQLPESFRATLETTEVVVTPAPTADMADADDPAETPPDMLGLFVGCSALERDDESAELPARIYLFQRNLERAAVDEEHLHEEIHVTLYHELGHLLGFDEDGVSALGLE